MNTLEPVRNVRLSSPSPARTLGRGRRNSPRTEQGERGRDRTQVSVLEMWRKGGSKLSGTGKEGLESGPQGVPRSNIEKRENKHPGEIRSPPEEVAKGQPDKSTPGEGLEADRSQPGPSPASSS